MVQEEPAHYTPSVDTAGLDAKTIFEMKRLATSATLEKEDHGLEQERRSLLEYTYVMETITQSNPDPASIASPNTIKEDKASTHSAQWLWTRK